MSPKHRKIQLNKLRKANQNNNEDESIKVSLTRSDVCKLFDPEEIKHSFCDYKYHVLFSAETELKLVPFPTRKMRFITILYCMLMKFLTSLKIITVVRLNGRSEFTFVIQDKDDHSLTVKMNVDVAAKITKTDPERDI